MKNSLRIVLFSVLLANTCIAEIIRIPFDKPTIQEGIDKAVNGDTVLVHPGMYQERIAFLGKNIVVASLYLMTADTSFIFRTIIDGHKEGAVVQFSQGEDSTAVLCGFTIRNGFAQFGGGINCYHCNPVLSALRVVNNTSYDAQKGNIGGGGIYCEDASPYIQNVIVEKNVTDFAGGGIFCRGNPGPVLENVIVRENEATYYGGGIYCGSGSMNMSGVTITENITFYSGGGLYFNYSSNAAAKFNTENRCSIFLNRAPLGSDIGCFQYTSILNVVLDTFTVKTPNNHYVNPSNAFQFDILNGKVEPVAGDLYVSPSGSDANTGMSSGNPL